MIFGRRCLRSSRPRFSCSVCFPATSHQQRPDRLPSFTCLSSAVRFTGSSHGSTLCTRLRIRFATRRRFCSFWLRRLYSVGRVAAGSFKDVSYHRFRAMDVTHSGQYYFVGCRYVLGQHHSNIIDYTHHRRSGRHVGRRSGSLRDHRDLQLDVRTYYTTHGVLAIPCK